MSYAVIQIEKFKRDNLGGVSRHINRTTAPENVDRARTHLNKTLIGSDDPAADVYKRIADAGITKTRKDATLAVGVLLTSDRKFFETDGQIDPKKVEAWEAKNVEWLKQKYGENCVNAKLHLDELTPHIHALVVPITPGKKLNFRNAFVDGREELAQLHTDYAKAMRGLGLQRANEKLRVGAQELHEHYASVSAPAPALTPTPKPKPVEKAPLTARISPEKFAQEQVEAYAQQVEQAQASNAAALAAAHAKAVEFDRLKAREAALAAENKRLADKMETQQSIAAHQLKQQRQELEKKAADEVAAISKDRDHWRDEHLARYNEVKDLKGKLDKAEQRSLTNYRHYEAAVDMAFLLAKKSDPLTTRKDVETVVNEAVNEKLQAEHDKQLRSQQELQSMRGGMRCR